MLDRVGLALAILSVLLGVISAVPIVLWWHRRNSYSWRQVRNGVKTLREQLRLRQFEPEVVVAFAKGGFLLADLLIREFDKEIPICALFTRRVILPEGRRTVELDPKYANLQGLAGKRILVVDDVIQTGATLAQVVDLLCHQIGASRSDVVTVVLGLPMGAVLYQPDIFAFRVEYSDRRPTFPWGEISLD